METLQIANLNIDVIRKDIKNIHLAVYPPMGRVRVAVPLKVTDEALRLFAISKISWIKKHQRKFLSQDRHSPREYITGESHYFLWKRYLLEVQENADKQWVMVKWKTKIILQCKPGCSKEKKEELMTEWYRSELKKTVPELIEKWEDRIGVKSHDWRIKTMSTRWWSCSILAKRIWLNLELVKKPLHAIEYVIAHELTHLLEKHHNERFMGLMDEYFPTWRSVKEELNIIV